MRNRGRDNNKKVTVGWQAGVPSIPVERAPFMRMAEGIAFGVQCEMMCVG
jgi:hypothetical protein